MLTNAARHQAAGSRRAYNDQHGASLAGTPRGSAPIRCTNRADFTNRNGWTRSHTSGRRPYGRGQPGPSRPSAATHAGYSGPTTELHLPGNGAAVESRGKRKRIPAVGYGAAGGGAGERERNVRVAGIEAVRGCRYARLRSNGNVRERRFRVVREGRVWRAIHRIRV